MAESLNFEFSTSMKKNAKPRNTAANLAQSKLHLDLNTSLTYTSDKSDLKTRLTALRTFYQEILGLALKPRRTYPTDKLRHFLNQLSRHKTQNLQERVIISQIKSISRFMLEKTDHFRKQFLATETISILDLSSRIYNDSSKAEANCDVIKSYYEQLLRHLSGEKSVRCDALERDLKALEMYKSSSDELLLMKTRGLLRYLVPFCRKFPYKLTDQNLIMIEKMPEKSLKRVLFETNPNNTHDDITADNFLNKSMAKIVENMDHEFSQDLFSDATKDLFLFSQQNCEIMKSLLLNTQISQQVTVPGSIKDQLPQSFDDLSHPVVPRNSPNYENSFSVDYSAQDSAYVKAKVDEDISQNDCSCSTRESPVLNNFSKRMQDAKAKKQESLQTDDEISTCAGFDETNTFNKTEQQSFAVRNMQQETQICVQMETAMTFSDENHQIHLICDEAKSNTQTVKREYFGKVKTLQEAREDVIQAANRISQPGYFSGLFRGSENLEKLSSQDSKYNESQNVSSFSWGSQNVPSQKQNQMKENICAKLKQQLLKSYNF